MGPQECGFGQIPVSFSEAGDCLLEDQCETCQIPKEIKKGNEAGDFWLNKPPPGHLRLIMVALRERG